MLRINGATPGKAWRPTAGSVAVMTAYGPWVGIRKSWATSHRLYVGRASEGPFGTTIVHAHLTLSLAPAILAEVVRIREVGMPLPVGLRDVRFPTPLPVGARFRTAVVVKRAEQKIVGFEATFSLSYEIEGGDQPACLADVIIVYP
jgi:hypothetical protein